jgi:hypothetical protein
MRFYKQSFHEICSRTKNDYKRDLLVQFSWGETYYTKQINDSPFSKFDFGISCGVGLKSLYLNGKEVLLDLRYQRGFVDKPVQSVPLIPE